MASWHDLVMRCVLVLPDSTAEQGYTCVATYMIYSSSKV